MTANDIFNAFAEAARAGQTMLDFHSKKFTDEAFAEAITASAAAGYLQRVHTLALGRTQVGDEGLKVLAAVAGQLPQLQSLDLSDTQVGDEGLDALAAVAGQLPQLQSLDLGDTQMGDQGLKALAAVAGQLPQLQSLDLSDTQVGDEGLKALATVVGQLQQLQSLDLSDTQVGDEGLKALAVTAQLQRLRTLALSRTEVGDEGLKALAATRQLQQLQSVDLSGTRVGDKGLKALAATAQLQQLQSVDLSGTRVGDKGLKALAATAQLQQLQTLDLSGTRVGDKGLKALATVVGQLQQLQTLDLSRTQVGDEGLKALATTAQLPQLQSLALSATRVGDEGLKALATTAQLPQLQSLALSATRVGDEGLKALAAVAGQLPQLQSLDLSDTQVGDKGLKALAAVAGQLQQLQSLDLNNSAIRAVDAATLESRDAKAIFAAILRGVALHVARVMFVGTTNVGKTWLVRRCFLDETVDPDEQRLSTHNIELVHPGNYRWQPTLTIGKENVRIETRVWDFAGQLVTHGVHEVFLPDDGRTVYVLVLSAKHRPGSLIVDGEETGNAILYWLKCIRYFVGEVAQVVLAITQSDGAPAERKIDDETIAVFQKDFSQLTPLELKAKFGVAVSAIVDKCSACESTEKSIVPLRRQLEAALELRDPIREAKVPPELVPVREKVEAELPTHALVDVDTFRNWCRQCGVAEERTQETFLRILHHMGCLFYFGHTRQEMHELDRLSREELRLAPGHKRFLQRDRDTILQTYLANPNWLKQAVYEAVQRSRDKPWISRKEMEDLMQQAHAGVRHAEGHFFARKFLDFVELSFFDEETWRYLLPRGLKPGRPLGYYDWPKASLQWSLSDARPRKRQHQDATETQLCFFHESAFHRFLVRMHKYGGVVRAGNTIQHWRDCVVLRLEGSTLAVGAHPDEGTIEIRFKDGREYDRQKAFDEVRRLFVKEFICQEPAPGSDTGPPTQKSPGAIAKHYVPPSEGSNKHADQEARNEFDQMRKIIEKTLELEDRPKHKYLAQMEEAYLVSHKLTDTLKPVYRLAAVFCYLSEYTFPINNSEWAPGDASQWILKAKGKRNRVPLAKIFEEGLKVFVQKLGRTILKETFGEDAIDPRDSQAHAQIERLRRYYGRAELLLLTLTYRLRRLTFLRTRANKPRNDANKSSKMIELPEPPDSRAGQAGSVLANESGSFNSLRIPQQAMWL